MTVYVPILNGAKNGWAFPLFLGDGLSLVGLSGDDYSNSVGAADEDVRRLVKKDVLAIRVEVKGGKEKVLADLESIVFLLNARSSGGPVKSPIAVSDERSWGPVSLPYQVRSGGKRSWKLDKLMNTGELAALVTAIRNVHAQAPSARIAVNRLLLSIYRESDVDRIIDLAIAFESLISGTSEVSFKCALYNAFTSQGSPSQRLHAYNEIKSLYDVRSKLVHGSLDAGDKRVGSLVDKIDDLYRLCAKAIIAYIAFLEDLADPNTGKLPAANEIDQKWVKRQLDLVMGVQV